MSDVINKIKVTNYKQGIEGKPLLELMPDKDFQYNNNELIINNSLFVHVFDILSYMRNIKQNEEWFKNNIYHF